MLLKEILSKSTQFLKDKKIESARLDSEILLSKTLGLKRIDLYLKHEQPLKKDEIDQCREVIVRRSKGEPVAYIVGEKEFFSLNFKVGSGVLVPRPETEGLVDLALEWIEKNKKDQPITVLDLGAGTGCIGLSLLKKIEQAKLISVERSPEAFRYLKENTELHQLQDRVQLVNEDVKDFVLNQSVDILVANPPYIAPQDPNVMSDVKKFEPHSALFASQEGLADIFSWTKMFYKNLNTTSLITMEIGCAQGPQVLDFYRGLEFFDQVEIKKDLSQLDRYIYATKGN